MKYQTLIAQMTLEEKASLLSGANFWNTKAVERLEVPSIMLTDGPHGLRKQGGKADNLGINKSIPSTCYPTASSLANSWDVAMLEEVGRALGKEARSERVNVVLGPGLNLKRNPLCGRNFEYYSEDPYLSGKLAAAMIHGIEEQGVAACPKHYTVNSQEHMRMTIDEIVDERALRELYLEGFRYAVVEGKPGMIMSSYNKVNGQYVNENLHLLKESLVEEWGFDGVVVTDWGGNNDRVAGLIAGNHLEMPSSGGVMDQDVVEAVKNGDISERLVDERVENLLRLIFKSEKNKNQTIKVNYQEHHKKAIEFAQQSMVLLKNEDNMLPLKKSQSVAVVGDFAYTPRYQGAGSSLVEPTYLDNALDTLLKKDLSIVGFAKGFNRFGGQNHRLVDEALELSKKADTVLLFMGLDEGSEVEGLDRGDMNLRIEQLELLEQIRQVNRKIVVVLSGGSPVELPFTSDVKAILHGYLGGQGGGEAVASLLVGEAVPSGKLAETYPLLYEDIPSSNYYPGRERTAEHRESIFVGYRYFDTVEKAVRFSFGHGLSYTTFEYSDLKLNVKSVSFSVKNIGDIAGGEIAQLYISKTGGEIFRPEQELKGFQKQWIEPGETKTYQIQLDDHTFAIYHIGKNSWVVEPGEYEIRVGSSSRDIRIKGKLSIAGDKLINPYIGQNIEPYLNGAVDNLSSQDFSQLYGKPLPEASWDRKADLGLNDTIEQARFKSCLGKFINWLIDTVRKFYLLREDPITAANIYFVQSLTFRQLYRFSMGSINRIKKSTMEGLLVLINKGMIKGILLLLKRKFVSKEKLNVQQR